MNNQTTTEVDVTTEDSKLNDNNTEETTVNSAKTDVKTPSTADEDVAVETSGKDNTKSIFEITNVHLGILAVLLCITLSLCLFHIYASKVTNPDYIAEKYATAKSMQDFKTMKGYFDTDIFDTSYDEVYAQNKLSIKINNMNLYTEYSGTDYIDYSYSYYSDDRSELQGGDVSLLLLPEKKWFLYDNWIVDPEYAIISDVKVKMLKSASATLGTMDLATIATKTTDNEDGMLIYTLPSLLRANYILNIDYSFSESVEFILEVDYESINNVTPELSSEQGILITEKAEEILHEIYNTNFPTLNFDDIYSNLALTAPHYFNESQFAIKFGSAFTSVNLTEYSITNIDSDMSMIMYDDNDSYSLFVSLSGDVYAAGEVVDSTSNDSYNDVFTGEINDFIVYFVFDEFNWVAADLQLCVPF